MTTDTTAPQFSPATVSVLDIVTDALIAKGRIPCQRPVLGLSNNLDHYEVAGFYVDRHPGGWVANITFDNVPLGTLNAVGTPDALPFACERQAFLAGAALVCKIFTGSDELPFVVTGDKLTVVGYATGGFSGLFSMTQQIPCAS